MTFKQLLELFTEHMTSTTEANERLMLSSHCSDVVYVSFSYFLQKGEGREQLYTPWLQSSWRILQSTLI